MRFVFNFYLTFILLFIYACACALGTFVENDFGVWDAKILIYNTPFFNALHALIFLNLFGLILRFKMWKKPAVFAFHFAILLIILGAFITRFWGFEASLSVQSANLSHTAISKDQNIIVISEKNGQVEQTFFPIFISPFKDYTELFSHYLPNFLAYPLGFFAGEIRQGFEPQKLILNGDEFEIKFDEFKVAQPPINHYPMIKISVSDKNESKSAILVQNFFDESLSEVKLKDNEILMSWGARFINLPFAVFLEEVQTSYYPGSTNPSNFSTKVLFLENNTSTSAQISMSKIADFKGFRLFLNSLDEDSALFSINKDPGKILTYFGYFVFFAGLILSLFAKNGRFLMLCKKLNFTLIFALLFLANNAKAEIINENKINYKQGFEILDKLNSKEFKTHAQNFAKIPVLSYEGRVKPFAALSLDLLHKISHKSEIYGLNHAQIALGAMLFYDEFMQVPLIRIKTQELRDFLGLGEFISVEDVYKDGVYKLQNELNAAQSKAQKTPYEKDIISVDEAVNLLIATSRAEILRVVPNELTWLSPGEALKNLPPQSAAEIQALFEDYFNTLYEAVENADFKAANKALSELKSYQAQHGSLLMPDKFTLWAEEVLIDFDIFANLSKFYLIFGTLLLLTLMSCVAFKWHFSVNLKCILRTLFCVSFFIFVVSFLLRWFIGKHAPWSNAYESMLLIALVLGILSTIFMRNLLFFALGIFGVGVVLSVANLGFMDPQITPLMPVLQSHWLNLHVSSITASYAFFVMAYLSSLAGLCAMSVRQNSVLNLATLTEVLIMLGLMLLIIGTFLGAIWANESWGRYWAWDPKETWSLILIIAYTLALHARFIKPLNSPFVLFLVSCVGFFVMLMCYFGVNYLLSGKHSYGSGDAISLEFAVSILLVFNVILAVATGFKK